MDHCSPRINDELQTISNSFKLFKPLPEVFDFYNHSHVACCFAIYHIKQHDAALQKLLFHAFVFKFATLALKEV